MAVGDLGKCLSGKLKWSMALSIMVLSLAACSSGGTAPPEALQPLAQRLGVYAPPSRFEATRAQIAAAGLTGPLLRVVVRKPLEQSAGYVEIGSANGVDFYTANDGSNVLVSNGLLRGTVSFPGDLDAADTAPIERALAAGGGSYFRVVRHRRGEGDLFESRLACRLVAAGREQIVILERIHAVLRYEEDCETDGFDPAGRRIEFKNLYWLEDGVIRASEQWVSFESEQIRVELVLP